MLIGLLYNKGYENRYRWTDEEAHRVTSRRVPSPWSLGTPSSWHVDVFTQELSTLYFRYLMEAASVGMTYYELNLQPPSPGNWGWS